MGSTAKTWGQAAPAYPAHAQLAEGVAHGAAPDAHVAHGDVRRAHQPAPRVLKPLQPQRAPHHVRPHLVAGARIEMGEIEGNVGSGFSFSCFKSCIQADSM